MSYKEKYTKYKNKCIDLKDKLNDKIRDILDRNLSIEEQIIKNNTIEDTTIEDLIDELNQNN